MFKLCVAALCLCALAMTARADLDANLTTPTYEFSVNAVGSSGKITFTAASDQGKSETIKIEMDSLDEKDSNEDVPGNSPKHQVTSFASKTFTFSALTTANYSGVEAKTFSFQASNLLSVADGSKLKVTVFLFTESGTIDMDGTDTDVSTGTMKFNVELEDWPFCLSSGGSGITNCNADGEFVDFSYVIKGSSSSASKDGNSNLFFLGGDASVLLSNKVTVDNVLTAMPAGYPKLETNGNKQTFIFRLPKGDKMVYDPILSASSASASWASASLLVLVLAVVKLF